MADKRPFSGVVALTLLVLVAGCGRGGRPVTVATVVGDLTNLAVFCEPPAGVSDMESTYDRKGGNADWWDVPKPVGGSKDLYEALRVQGPGCLKRIWMTNVPATEWLFYFDGESVPRLRLSTATLFTNDNPEPRLIRGGCSSAYYSYLPMPFAKSLRVLIRMPEIAANARPYFQFNYERYPSSTSVTTWAVKMDESTTNTLLQANAVWRQAAADDAAIVRRQNWRRQAIPARQQVEVLSETRGGMITTFAVRPDFSLQNAVMRSLLLRSLVLECYWDGATQPSVQVPLGDFFCNGLHPRQFASLPMSNTEGAYLCRLPMPFHRQCRIVIRNEGPVDAALDTAAEFTPGDVGDRLYLHAAFNSALGSASPFHVMHTTGRGKYVGCYLVSLGMDGSWNILEGDEYFYRDGGATPVHHGTGVEDYFNAGWYYFCLFEFPLHGLLDKAAMRTCQYRFHLTDPVTFRQDLRMEWEVGGGPGCPANGYMSAATYWYQDKPGPAGSTLPAVNQRFPPLDQIAYRTIMDELFELERMGLIADAEERCAFYAGALQQMPEHWMLELRRLAYREMRAGHGAVRTDIAALTAMTNLPPDVAQQAKLLLWRGEKPGRAIFGAHAYAEYRLLVDGKPVGQGNDPFIWQAFPVELTLGEHILQAEVTPQPQQAFFSAGFSAFFTNVVSDATWDFSRTKPDGWPEPASAHGEWRPIEVWPRFFPTMSWWQFAPNAIPCVQSADQQGGPYADWANPPGRTVYLRRRIMVPTAAGDRPPMPPRATIPGGTAVRPPDDTSNEGITHRR